jgi:hypothetical protein
MSWFGVTYAIVAPSGDQAGSLPSTSRVSPLPFARQPDGVRDLHERRVDARRRERLPGQVEERDLPGAPAVLVELGQEDALPVRGGRTPWWRARWSALTR